MEKALVKKVYKEVSKDLSEIYKKRKIYIVFQKIMWIITGIFFAILFLNMLTGYFPDSGNILQSLLKDYQGLKNNPYANTYPFIGLIILLYPALYIFSRAFQNFKKKETATIHKMVKMLFPHVEFTQDVIAPIKEIEKSKLFTWVKDHTPMYNYGQIRSTVNNTIINITDIGIVEENVSNKTINALLRIPGLNIVVILYQYVLKNIFTSKSADSVYYTFRGMFCWLRYPKKLKGHTVVLVNNQNTKLNRFVSSKFSEEEKILLEDIRFAKEFIVYSTDQVEARYVLSTALMERILSLKEKFNQPILLSFHNQEMYLAVQNKNGLFSFASGKIDTIEVIQELANDIETALDITQELKFNPKSTVYKA